MTEYEIRGVLRVAPKKTVTSSSCWSYGYRNLITYDVYLVDYQPNAYSLHLIPGFQIEAYRSDTARELALQELHACGNDIEELCIAVMRKDKPIGVTKAKVQPVTVQSRLIFTPA